MVAQRVLYLSLEAREEIKTTVQICFTQVCCTNDHLSLEASLHTSWLKGILTWSEAITAWAVLLF